MLHELLMRVGYSSREADLYLALLHAGVQPASAIASKVGYNRITAYQVLMDLVRKGVVSVSTRANVRYFSAEPPERILAFLECNRVAFEEQIHLMKDQLPVFYQLINPGSSKPLVRYFVGSNGIRSVYENTLNDAKEIFAIQNLSTISQDLGDYVFRQYEPRRAEYGVKFRLLLPDDKENKILARKNSFRLCNIRFISRKHIPFDSAILLYNKKTAVISHGANERFGAIIESPAFFSTMHGIFRILWAKGKCGSKIS